ncbi:diguanylate cyclase (GGDEF) domain-containing protein [Anaerosporobacter mobilis DSM 15930]|jgi:putative two-component system response regulator|uniref:Diguanylate cyclase (GGDEF) domain-containing protein n=1 Tax=Anaerosporobacter mobilis DSM 15930 TaxID=1120996 RepID=A0A1M7N5Q0_9FIRM|nr:GGDEF domain-containing protein [Anaerosporobacter mobilis]SHM98767.1 diguanylate cyclase (GGDEF) domain-containing protein [Anaerosporobacter mobilis DSM 15930]
MAEKLSLQNIKNAIESMKSFFDIVRLVDTTKTTVISYDEELNILKEQERCYKLWNKDVRCENCTSMCGTLEGCAKTKYEFIEGDLYHVSSKPVVVCDESGNECKIVLEIINGVSDDVLFHKFGINDQMDQSVVSLIAEIYHKVYEDPLTKVYNRRYLEEFIYLYKNNDEVAKRIGFIMADLSKFKEINDLLGHDIGDRILIDVAATLKEHIEPSDSVIRMGGDEFVIVLVNYTKEMVVAKMELLRKEVNKICYNEPEQSYVVVDMGYSFTESFETTKEFVNHMLKEADESMYLMKKRI